MWQSGLSFLAEQEILLFPKRLRSSLGPTQPPIQWAPRPIYPEIKQLGNEANNSSPSSTVFK